MNRMEFLQQNLYDTTTMVAVSSGTDTAQYLFDNGTRMSYESSGQGTNGQTVTFSITFPTTTVSAIILKNHNWKSFNVFLFNNPGNYSMLDTTQNSDTSNYVSIIYTNGALIDNVGIHVTATITPDQEKRIGEIWVCGPGVVFDRNPSSNDYDPGLTRKQILHEMPDGGTVAYNIKEKFQAKLKWKYAAATFRDAILTVYMRAKPFVFVPFPTATAWDGQAYECIWTGKWDWTYSNNVKGGGWEGSIAIAETPGG